MYRPVVLIYRLCQKKICIWFLMSDSQWTRKVIWALKTQDIKSQVKSQVSHHCSYRIVRLCWKRNGKKWNRMIGGKTTKEIRIYCKSAGSRYKAVCKAAFWPTPDRTERTVGSFGILRNRGNYPYTQREAGDVWCFPLSGITGLSFSIDSRFLSCVLFFYLVLLLFLSCHFFANGALSWLLSLSRYPVCFVANLVWLLLSS